MKKKIIVFAVAAAVSLAAATYRWNDSAHAIGVIKAGGGSARHPVSLESGEESYMLIATATVVPPYRGNVKIVLEGEPAMEYEIHASGPIVDLGLHDWPAFRDNTLSGLKPGDRPALWVSMKPPRVDPVCNMAVESWFIPASYAGKEYRFCSPGCRAAFGDAPDTYRDRDRARGKYTLAFHDTATDSPVLKIPIIIRGKGEAGNAGDHHH